MLISSKLKLFFLVSKTQYQLIFKNEIFMSLSKLLYHLGLKVLKSKEGKVITLKNHFEAKVALTLLQQLQMNEREREGENSYIKTNMPNTPNKYAYSWDIFNLSNSSLK